MELFVDRRMRNFSLIMLLIACVMFVLFGYFVYMEGQNVQLQNFEEIGKHYTMFAEDALNEMKNVTKLKMRVIAEHNDTEDFVSNPYDVIARYQVQVVINNIMRDVEGFKFARVVPSRRADRSLIIGRYDTLMQGELIVPESVLKAYACYVNPLVFNGNEVELVMAAGIFVEDKMLGTLYTHIDISGIFRTFSENIVFRDTGIIVFVGEDGQLLFQSDRWPYSENAIGDMTQLSLVEHNETTSSMELDGEDYYAYGLPVPFSDVEGNHIHITFLQKESELFSLNRQIVQSTVVIIIAFLFLYALVLYVNSRYHAGLIQRDTQYAVEETLDTEVEKQTRVLRKIAETDALTGLYNHGSVYRIIEEEVEQAERDGTPLVLMMLDVDYFKDVNDNYGHQVGDEVLKAMADLLVDSIRDVDVAGRYGGEEFVLLLKDTHLDLGYSVAERIRQTVMSKTFTEHVIQLTVSIGIAEWHDEDVATLIKRADKKLYDSKNYGRNKTTF